MTAAAPRAKRKPAAEKPFPPPSPQWVSLARDRWVRYPIGDAGVRRLQELLATPPRVRMPCMLIYGVSGAGKSMLLESCCERSNVEFACGTASDAAKPHTLLNINYFDSCSVFTRDRKRGLDPACFASWFPWLPSDMRALGLAMS